MPLLCYSVLLLVIFATYKIRGQECAADQNEAWSYSGANGPPFWKDNYPVCVGQNQSPIDIDTSTVVVDNNLKAVEFVNYHQAITSADIINDGHTVQLTPTDGVTRSIQNGGLSGTYQLTQFHFHWGKRPTSGSEHRIDGRAFEMEMHLVHQNSLNSLAVIGLFLQESSFNNPSLSPFVKALKSIKYRGETTTLQTPLNLRHILPRNQGVYYRYNGSLTTPSCDEGVIWTVLAQPVTIGTSQIQEFRRLRSTRQSEDQDKQCYLVDNFRPVQSLNNRVVTSPKKAN